MVLSNGESFSHATVTRVNLQDVNNFKRVSFV